MRQRKKAFIKATETFLTYLAVMVVMVVMLTALLLSGGCTRKVYVPVESTVVHTDTVTHYLSNTDSVTVIERIYESDTRYDSIAPVLDSLNRVIGWDRYHFRETTKTDSREIERLKSLVDSLKAVKCDSVDRPVSYPVERELTKWERVKQDVGGMAIGGLIAAVLAAVIVWIVKRKRRR